ncbi:sulfite exporter TauE/SafE family protein [Candidatus Azambacteria bacterium]|nr:sulfite exporter TauE/SafE family protein [Candidatus Azambacteria bacterium]MBI3684819.1 sulfite exporter TauE/SafE family protein [Candidatus Azambacteria bacterium]
MDQIVSSEKPGRDWSIFLSSVFFVLGFSLVFSLVGVLLQTVLSSASYTVQEWLGRIGGVIIILFGFFLLGFFTPAFLKRGHTVTVKRRFHSHYLTSFVFGAAFAVGWTPCVSVALGAILALASTAASSAFFLLFAYTLGIGIPFLLVGLFTNQAQALINRLGKKLLYFQYFFGAVLIAMGVFVFTGTLSRIANLQFLTDILLSLNLVTSIGEGISSLTIFNFIVSFLAGVGSFLSPCMLPLIPGFLSYLASTAVNPVSDKPPRGG